MTEFLNWLGQHIELFIGFWFLLVSGNFALFAWRRHRAGPRHPPFSESEVLFSEKYVSGSSDKNLLTRLGGAHNALEVTVLKDALLVEPVGILKWILPPGASDLEHYVPRSDVLRVEDASTPGRKFIRIEIRGRDGARRSLTLAARRHEQLIAALKPDHSLAR